MNKAGSTWHDCDGDSAHTTAMRQPQQKPKSNKLTLGIPVTQPSNRHMYGHTTWDLLKSLRAMTCYKISQGKLEFLFGKAHLSLRKVPIFSSGTVNISLRARDDTQPIISSGNTMHMHNISSGTSWHTINNLFGQQDTHAQNLFGHGFQHSLEPSNIVIEMPPTSFCAYCF